MVLTVAIGILEREAWELHTEGEKEFSREVAMGTLSGHRREQTPRGVLAPCCPTFVTVAVL